MIITSTVWYVNTSITTRFPIQHVANKVRIHSVLFITFKTFWAREDKVG